MAFSTDAMAGATNPATMAFVGARADVGMQFFVPSRSVERSGNAYGLNGSANSSDNLFLVPSLGINMPLNDQFSLGLTVYGNGGMETNYPANTLHCSATTSNNILCGSTRLGLNLEQLIIAPTATWKVTPNFAIGVAPLIARQTFSNQGLQALASPYVSASPANLTNNGTQATYGGGVRVGVDWKTTNSLTLGATVQSPIYMDKFSSYSGYFAQQGAFNVPATFAVGFAWPVTPTLTVGLDDEYILFNGVASLGHSSSALALLGSSNGPGFGWRNVNVIRVGLDYQVIPDLTLRAGYNHADNPVTSANVTPNMLAPGVITDNLTAGATWQVTQQAALTLAYVHGIKNSISGPTSTLIAGGGTDKISLGGDEIDVALSWKW